MTIRVTPIWLAPMLLVRLASGTDAQVAPKPMMNHFPVWSPVEDQILFDSDRDGDSEIYTVHVDSGIVRKLTDNRSLDANARWSRDGKRVVFRSNRDGKDRVFEMDADGTNQRLVEHPSDEEDVMSPDGRTKVAVAAQGGTAVLMAIDGAGARTQLTRGTWASQPAFAPNGQRIVFEERVGDDISQSRIVVMNIDGSSPRDLAIGTDPSWSPDGTHILFKTPTAKSGGFGWEIAVIRLENLSLVRLGPGVLPNWSPDGLRIAYMVETNAQRSDIWLMTRDGTNQKCLTCAH